MDNKELIKKYLERWEGLQVASIQYYAETGKISGFLYLAINKMLEEKAKEAYNQGVRDAAESKSGINIKYKDHVSVVLTANDRDTYTSKSEDFMDFLHSVDKDLISKQSILKLLK